VLTIEVAAINGAPPPVAVSARFDSGGTIGRDPGCTLVLPDPEKRVSRRHALVESRGNRFFLRNQGSAIAVLLNGVPVEYGGEAQLAAGDQIVIGEFLLRVTAAAEATAGSASPSATSGDILAGFGSNSSDGNDPFADLIPPVAAPAARAPTAHGPSPAVVDKRREASGLIPDDFDPFGETPAEPPAHNSSSSDRADFADLVPARQERVDDLFGLQSSGDPFPPGHPLAAPTSAATPGPAGIDDLLKPGATGSRQTPIVPVQRDDAPEINAPMRLPGAVTTARRAEPTTPPPVQSADTVATDKLPLAEPLSDEGPATKGGMRLSWDERGEAGLFEAKRTVVIGSGAAERRRGERRQSPPLPPASAALPAAQAAEQPDLLQALLDGLAMDRWPGERKLDEDTLRRLGRLLRSAVQGTIDLLRARALIKSEVQAHMTMIVSLDNNPLKFSPNAEAALAHLLGPSQRGFMSADAAMQDAYRDLVAHQFGFTAGTRAALGDVLKRFDPAQLESRLTTKSALDSLLPARRKAKLWDLFAERFAQLSAEAEDDFQRLFGKEFLRAYEAQIAKMKVPEHRGDN
jgi:FHA domain-containing protein